MIRRNSITKSLPVGPTVSPSTPKKAGFRADKSGVITKSSPASVACSESAYSVSDLKAIMRTFSWKEFAASLKIHVQNEVAECMFFEATWTEKNLGRLEQVYNTINRSCDNLGPHERDLFAVVTARFDSPSFDQDVTFSAVVMCENSAHLDVNLNWVELEYAVSSVERALAVWAVPPVLDNLTLCAFRVIGRDTMVGPGDVKEPALHHTAQSPGTVDPLYLALPFPAAMLAMELAMFSEAFHTTDPEHPILQQHRAHPEKSLHLLILEHITQDNVPPPAPTLIPHTAEMATSRYNIMYIKASSIESLDAILFRIEELMESVLIAEVMEHMNAGEGPGAGRVMSFHVSPLEDPAEVGANWFEVMYEISAGVQRIF